MTVCILTVQALTLARKVVIVPGYGLAVASAQATVADLVATLRKNGVDVSFAIHPVVSTHIYWQACRMLSCNLQSCKLPSAMYRPKSKPLLRAGLTC